VVYVLFQFATTAIELNEILLQLLPSEMVEVCATIDEHTSSILIVYPRDVHSLLSSASLTSSFWRESVSVVDRRSLVEIWDFMLIGHRLEDLCFLLLEIMSLFAVSLTILDTIL
jgi:hypothetical protein